MTGVQTCALPIYRDYVIKDGKFVGKFEEMYQNCDDPWNQDEGDFVFKSLSLDLLERLGYQDFQKILDIGCGKGRFTSEIQNRFPQAEVFGIDISESAIRKAEVKYPHIFFQQFDVRKASFQYQNFDCIFITEVIWYILPEIERVFREIHEGLKQSEGIFVLNNHFYQDDEQKYGREKITTLQTLLEIFPFHVEYTLENNRLDSHDVTIIASA